MLMPTPEDRIAMLDQQFTLLADFRRGKTVFIPALSGEQIPTAESATFADMYVWRMWMVVRENENAIPLQPRPRHFIVWKECRHSESECNQFAADVILMFTCRHGRPRVSLGCPSEFQQFP